MILGERAGGGLESGVGGVEGQTSGQGFNFTLWVWRASRRINCSICDLNG